MTIGKGKRNNQKLLESAAVCTAIARRAAIVMKRVVDLPDGVVFKVLEYMYGTAGARVPEITPPTHVTTPSEEPDEVLRKAIRALSETLRISDREAVELLLSSQQT